MGTALFGLRVKATLVFVAVVLAGTLAAFSFPTGRFFFIGLMAAAVLEVPSYWALSLTLRLSNNKFFGAFVGGMLGRLVGLGCVVGILWRRDPGTVIPFVLGAVVGLIGFSFVELFFIGRQNRLPI